MMFCCPRYGIHPVKSHQASHFCPSIATSRLNSSSRNTIAVRTYLSPCLSSISTPSAISRSKAHPTTSFAFHPSPPSFLSSLISATGTDQTGFSSSSPRSSVPFVAMVLFKENETHGIVARVLMYACPRFPWKRHLNSIGPVRLFSRRLGMTPVVQQSVFEKLRQRERWKSYPSVASNAHSLPSPSHDRHQVLSRYYL